MVQTKIIRPTASIICVTTLYSLFLSDINNCFSQKIWNASLWSKLHKTILVFRKIMFWVLACWGERLIKTKTQYNTSLILFEWNEKETKKSYTPNSLQLKDILRCGADDPCRPQNSQTQGQLVWYSHNTSLFVFAWPAAEHRLCPPLGAATTEMDVKAFISLMHHNNEDSTLCAEQSNWPSISPREEVNKHMMFSNPKALLK